MPRIHVSGWCAAGVAVGVMAAAFAAPADAQTPPGPAASTQTDPVVAFFSKTTVSGTLDVFYGYDFNTPPSGAAQFRSYDGKHNSIDLALADIAFEKVPTADSRAGFRIDLDYGTTPQIVNAAEPGGSTFENVGQAYVSYLAPAGTGLQVDVGKFYTPIGNEVVKAKDDWNYSRSLLFTLAEPTYHMGVRLSYSPNSRVSLGADVVNGWNDVVDNNGAKTVAGSITLKPTAALSITEAYMGGPEQPNDDADWRHLADTVVSYTATPKVSVAANYDYGRDTVAGAPVHWQGIAGYLRLQPVQWFAFSPRVEHYSDPQGFTSGTPQSLNEVTLTAEFASQTGVLLRLEYRRDGASPAPAGSDGSTSGVFAQGTGPALDHQDTFVAAVIYSFSSKQ